MKRLLVLFALVFLTNASFAETLDVDVSLNGTTVVLANYDEPLVTILEDIYNLQGRVRCDGPFDISTLKHNSTKTLMTSKL
jgi:hypothetical protein